MMMMVMPFINFTCAPNQLYSNKSINVQLCYLKLQVEPHIISTIGVTHLRGRN